MFVGKPRSVSERSESVTSDPGVLKASGDEKPDKPPDNQDEVNEENSKPDRVIAEDGDAGLSTKSGKIMASALEEKLEAGTSLTDFKVQERQSAVDFVDELSKILPTLLHSFSASEVDETLQKFSSDFSNSKFTKAEW